MQWRPRPLLPNISGRLPCTMFRTCSRCCVPTPLIWSAVPCRARSKESRAWSRNARSETEHSPSLIVCKAWMSFSATTTSPKPSAASDRLRPPGCAPVRAHGVEGIPALDSRKDKTMTILMQASRQWASRPADERYASLLDMQSTMTRRRERSRASVESTRALTVLPDERDPQHRGLYLGIERGPLAGQLLAPTHQAFGQICSLAATPSPASYFRENRVPAEIIADALNYNLRFTRDVEDVDVLATMGDEDNSLEGSAQPVILAIETAREKRVQDDLDAFLAKRFGRSMVEPIKAIHQVEEERPIETLWDVTVAVTAHARSIPNNDKRLEIKRAAGELLKLAA